MAKTESKLTLKDRQYGISTNFDANGSFAYAENIDIRSDGKRIKLSPKLNQTNLFTGTNTLIDIFQQNAYT